MNLNISLIDLEEEKTFIIPEDGVYLVKTRTNHLNKIHYFSTHASKHFDEKKGIWKNSFNVSNQEVIAVSSRPLSACK